MKEDERKSVGADNAMLSEGIESLALPNEFHGTVHQAAVDLDEFLSQGQIAEEAVQVEVMAYREKLLHHLAGGVVPPPRPWPSSLYIPAGADWQNYWFRPPPDNHRYALDWAPPPSPAGFNEASRVEGKIFCTQRIRTIDQFATSQAGLGVFFTPQRTLSVSLQPYVTCSGDYRWFQEIDHCALSSSPSCQPGRPASIAGFTQVTISLTLAAWQRIADPQQWVLIHQNHFTVRDVQNSGSGHGAISSYDQSFSGQDLATPFHLESARTYLLGVVARVSIRSTLTDTQGRPLPLIENGTFRVWGSIGCVVPKIELIEQ